jgi:transcriptional regulator with XRE-family HTH domain
MYTCMKTQLRRIRQDRGLSQREVAALVGADHVTVCHAENGYVPPRESTRERWAAGLGVSPQELFPVTYIYPQKERTPRQRLRGVRGELQDDRYHHTSKR